MEGSQNMRDIVPCIEAERYQTCKIINILCLTAQPLGYAMFFIDFDKNFKLTVYLSIKKTHRHISLCIMAKEYSTGQSVI